MVLSRANLSPSHHFIEIKFYFLHSAQNVNGSISTLFIISVWRKIRQRIQYTESSACKWKHGGSFDNYWQTLNGEKNAAQNSKEFFFIYAGKSHIRNIIPMRMHYKFKDIEGNRPKDNHKQPDTTLHKQDKHQPKYLSGLEEHLI